METQSSRLKGSTISYQGDSGPIEANELHQTSRQDQGDQGPRQLSQPCLTTDGLVVFIESDRPTQDGSGSLGSVQLRRPLHSYQSITQAEAGRFHSPAPLPDNTILVSRLTEGSTATYAVERFDPATGRREPVFDDPDYHDLLARVVIPRPEPDGRSSVVRPSDPHGELYCLNVYTSDEPTFSSLQPGTVKRVRLIAGAPASASGTACIMGDTPVAADGSFAVQLPANTPVQLQLLDEQGMALRSCRWIWARNREPRGCIGCHEDGELTPENLFVDAMKERSTLVDARRSIDFQADVLPLLQAGCRDCHDARGDRPRLFAEGNDDAERVYESLLAKATGYVIPGRARASPLVWHLLGRNTARPWDGAATQRPAIPIAPDTAHTLTDDQVRMLIEWIDLGAPFLDHK